MIASGFESMYYAVNVLLLQRTCASVVFYLLLSSFSNGAEKAENRLIVGPQVENDNLTLDDLGNHIGHSIVRRANNLNLGFPEVSDKCILPEGDVGLCVVYTNCWIVKDYEKSQLIEFLHEHGCGFEDFAPKVCCPDKTALTERQGDEDEKSQNPPDVSKHKNVNLIQHRSCGLLNDFNKILFGEKTSLFEFSWMALLSYRYGTKRSFQCGGSLINERYVLTAAHCLTNLGTGVLVGVRLGEHNIDTEIDCEDIEGQMVCAPPVQDFEVEEIIPHPKYSSNDYRNDIGLVRLKGKANIDEDNVKPVCLPLSENLRTYNFTGKNVTLTGWGVTETGKTSSVLLKVQVSITEEEFCKKAYQNSSPRVPITNKQLCTGEKDRYRSCRADSGGPVQIVDVVHQDVRYVQHGIISFATRNCSLEGFPGVHTKVTYYMDWILDTIKP